MYMRRIVLGVLLAGICAAAGEANAVEATSVSFTVQPGQPVYVCTELVIAGMPPIHKDNYEDPNKGDQCDRTGSIGTDPDEWHFDPMTPWANYCVTPQPGFPPVCMVG